MGVAHINRLTDECRGGEALPLLQSGIRNQIGNIVAHPPEEIPQVIHAQPPFAVGNPDADDAPLDTPRVQHGLSSNHGRDLSRPLVYGLGPTRVRNVGERLHTGQASLPPQGQADVARVTLAEAFPPSVQAWRELLFREESPESIYIEHLTWWRGRFPEPFSDRGGHDHGTTEGWGLVELTRGEEDKRVLVEPRTELLQCESALARVHDAKGLRARFGAPRHPVASQPCLPAEDTVDDWV
mmetsp:Transcript_51542/g.109609  ORF Transcript_51542/g.109609 Transcript_51542/m.109609 type:complete len:240 (+) Transcript_51542:547-1266(+)